jgi:thioredoxin 1
MLLYQTILALNRVKDHPWRRAASTLKERPMYLLRHLLLAAMLFAGATTSAWAAERRPFVQQEFSAAQAAGKPILVEIHAPWCPTCKAQQSVLNKLEAEPKFKDLQVFRVDFDSQKNVVKSFKATTQSTLIVFKGDKEMGRSVGDTSAASIAALLNKAL